MWNKKDVVSMFNEIYHDEIIKKRPDLGLLRQGWNDLLDHLKREGNITEARANQWTKPKICKD